MKVSETLEDEGIEEKFDGEEDEGEALAKQCGVCDDDVAARWLLLTHRRRGHCCMKEIRTMYDSGELSDAPRLERVVYHL